MTQGAQLLRNDVNALQKLAQEFSSELAMLGADVEQIKRNVNGLTDRVSKLETAVAKMPKITGSAGFGFRAASVTADGVAGFEAGAPNAVAPNPIAFPSDRDGRLLNPSSSILDRVNAFYDIDLGISANISNAATVRMLLNAGNYLRGYLGNRISQVNPLLDNGVEGLGTAGAPNFTVEDVVPYYLYLEMPWKAWGLKTHLTVGKFGQQFTPYTLKMVDVDTYFHNDKTDSGDYPVTGARLNFKALGLNWETYAAVHSTDYAALTSTAGGTGVPGLYLAGPGVGDASRFQPEGANTFLIAGGAGSVRLDQTAGVRATWKGKRWTLGATYLTGATSEDDSGALFDANGDGIADTAPSDVHRQLSVYGVDLNGKLWKKVTLSASITQTEWSGEDNRIAGLSTDSITDNDRRAWDLRLRSPIGKGTITGFYKRIGEGFDAPGNWGRIGNWINPRGIEGFGGTLDWPIAKKWALHATGARYNYEYLRRALGAASDLTHIRGGLRYKMGAKDTVNFDYELVNFDGSGGGSLSRVERWLNVGWNHQFNSQMSFRFLYQFLNLSTNGLLDAPGYNYKANIVATQFQVRF